MTGLTHFVLRPSVPLTLLLVTLVPIAACTSPGCDPTQADFFTGLGNAAAGCYVQRTAAYQEQLQVSAEQREAAAQTAASAEAHSQAEQRKVAILEERLRVLDRDAAVLQGRLDAARRRSDLSQKALQRAQHAIDEFRQQNAAAAARTTPEAVAAAEKKRREAEQRLHDALISH